MKIVIKGIVKHTSTWVGLASVDVDLSNASESDVEQGAEQIRDVIAASFKEGANGHLTFGDVVINIQSFATISVEIVK